MATIVDSDFDPTTTPAASIWPTAIRWAIISSVIGIVLQLLFYVLGWSDPATLSTNVALAAIVGGLAIVISVLIEFLGLKSYRDTANRGWLTVGQAVKWALAFGLIAGVIGAIWALIYNGFIAGDMVSDLQQAQINEMEERGASPEEIEMAESVFGVTTNPLVTIAMTILGSVIMAAIIGAIVGLVLRTPGPRETYA